MNHSTGQYVDDDGNTTNAIESCWAQLKRVLKGVYHQISIKHLHRYLAELMWRHNHRGTPVLEQMGSLVRRMDGRQLRLMDMRRVEDQPLPWSWGWRGRWLCLSNQSCSCWLLERWFLVWRRVVHREQWRFGVPSWAVPLLVRGASGLSRAHKMGKSIAAWHPVLLPLFCFRCSDPCGFPWAVVWVKLQHDIGRRRCVEQLVG